jgi:hypothetical protein
MKSKPLSVLSAVLMILAQSAFAQEPPADPSQKDAPAETKAQPPAEQPIDFNRARQLLQKKRNGQDLSADEEAYLQRAQEARRRQQGPPNNPRQPGGRDNRVLPPNEKTGFKPLDEMSAEDNYHGEDGGLYGGGMNQPPEKHRDAAEREIAKIEPLNSAGKPSP